MSESQMTKYVMGTYGLHLTSTCQHRLTEMRDPKAQRS